MEKAFWEQPSKTVIEKGEAQGLPYVMSTGPHGNLNGYVGVPRTHPWFGVGYSECVDKSVHHEDGEHPTPESLISVHGGVTYAGYGGQIGLDETVWWFGFDTSHAGDYVPKYNKEPRELPWGKEELRDEVYVRAECIGLAAQLAAVQEKK